MLFLSMRWDSKKDWIGKKKELYLRIMTSPYLPLKVKERVQTYSNGLWETPKVYTDGFAYNDGSWLLYNTCRSKGGTFKNKIYCKTKNDVIKNLYSYLSFLKKVGLTNTLEMGYFATCHIIYRFSLPEGVFPQKSANMVQIEELIKKVTKNDVSCDCKDPRNYCMDPKMKKGKKKGQITMIQRMKDKELLWKKIEELYDETLTNSQNIARFKEEGLEVSESTLHRWKRQYRGCQMVFDDKITRKSLC